MRYRTFKGKTKQEAFAQLNIEKQHDPDLKEARLIKHSEEQVSSFMGLKKETVYEIVVGIPEHIISVSKTPEKTKSLSSRTSTKENSKFSSIEQNVIKKRYNPEIQETLFALENVSRVAEQISQLEHSQKRTATASKKNGTVSSIPLGTAHKKIQEFDQLKGELNSIKSEVQNIQNLLFSHMQTTKSTSFQNQVIEQIQEEQSLPNDYEIYKQHLRWIEHYLSEREFSPFFIEELKQELQKYEELLKNKNEIIQFTKQMLLNNIPVSSINLDNYQFGNTVIFIGSTGVGKTSSIVKLAAHLALMRKKSFRFISIDRYKVGGETQLEKLAEYMKADFHAINRQEEFFELLEDHSKDFTFIDTAGKSPKELIVIQELAHWIDLIKNHVNIHLVVSASTKTTDLEYIFDSYSLINYHHILITKLDETKTYGSVLSIAYKYKKPFSFLTDGQEIPQDFAIANIAGLIDDALA
ncbi:MAG: hypothetical protein ACRCTQ_03195 [Brevinemataceae bacterium]